MYEICFKLKLKTILRLSEEKVRKIIREETKKVLSEDMNKYAYKRHLENLPITEDDVIKTEEGSHIGFGATGGYKIKTDKKVLDRSSLQKAGEYKGLKFLKMGNEGFVFHVT